MRSWAGWLECNLSGLTGAGGKLVECLSMRWAVPCCNTCGVQPLKFVWAALHGSRLWSACRVFIQHQFEVEVNALLSYSRLGCQQGKELD